jgi:hypothetical protein
MAGNVNRSTGSGIGSTGAGRGAGTGTAAAYGAGAVDTVEQDPPGAGWGDAPPPKASRLEPRRLGREETVSGSTLTFVKGVAASDETSWTS